MSTLYWQEETPTSAPAFADAVVDVLFALDCRSLPVDHAAPLARALLAAVPWMAEEPCCGIHGIHVAGSQNGWQRPAADGDQPLMLSKRTKLAVRVPRARVAELRAALENRQFDIAGSALRVQTGKERALSRETTLFARHVCCGQQHDEDGFLDWAAGALAAMDIRIRKALCGKSALLRGPVGDLPTRSLMLASLDVEESLRLQQQGLGPHRELGCGIFIPHKGIDPAGPVKDAA